MSAFPPDALPEPAAAPATLADALRHAAVLGLERLDAQILLLHALGRDPQGRAWLLAHDTDALAPGAAAAFEALCLRRATAASGGQSMGAERAPDREVRPRPRSGGHRA